MQTIPLKFILLGDSGVGKSQLSRRFTKNDFKEISNSTEGMEFSTRQLQFEKSLVKAQIWDTAGVNRSDNMTKAYFTGAAGAMLVYDINNINSFNNIRDKWLPQLNKYGHENMLCILVGNKSDIIDSDETKVSNEQAISLAEANGMDFIVVSAKSGKFVENCFRCLILSVTKLLPEIKTHLDITGLPEGWFVSYKLRANCDEIKSSKSSDSIESNRLNSASSGSNKFTSRKVDISSAISKSSYNKNEEFGVTASSVNTESNEVIVVYTNYWTGEESCESPIQSAPTGLLYKFNTTASVSLNSSNFDEKPFRDTMSLSDRYSSGSRSTSRSNGPSPIIQPLESSNDELDKFYNSRVKSVPVRNSSIDSTKSKRRGLDKCNCMIM